MAFRGSWTEPGAPSLGLLISQGTRGIPYRDWVEVEMAIEIRELPPGRMAPRTKRWIFGAVVAIPGLAFLLVRRTLRGGASLSVISGVIVVIATLVALSYLRQCWRTRRHLSMTREPFLVASGKYSDIWTALHGSNNYPKLEAYGQDLRAHSSRIVIELSRQPIRLTFLTAWGPSLGVIDAPAEMDLVVWTRGDSIRQIDVVLGSRTASLEARGSVGTVSLRPSPDLG